MTQFMVIWSAMLAAFGSVTAVSITPDSDRTQVVVEVEGPVRVTHFALSGPDRIVVDISGSRHALPQERYGPLELGGVTGIRLSQYQTEVVRFVIDLDRPMAYRLDQENGLIRISLQSGTQSFSPWWVGSGGATTPLSGDRVAAAVTTVSTVPGGTMAAARPPAPAPAAPVAPAPAARRDQPQITMYFRDTAITDVLATFAEFSGRSIIAGEGVSGNIHADIRNQPWDVALEALLVSYGFAAQEMESGIIRVDKLENLREREKVEELVTRSFAIKFANADSIRPAIEGLITDRGRVTRSSATNMLVVTDGRSIVEQRIAPMIEQLDVRTPQVTIAAQILFVDRTALEELGVVYDLKDSRGNQLNQVIPGGFDQNGDGVISFDEQTNENVVRLGGSSIAALANANFRPASSSLQVLSTLVLGRHSLLTFIDALRSLSVTDIQASPVITTLDHREAHVQVGEETPIRVIDAGAGGGGGGPGGGQEAPRATVQMKNTGIILRVTPHVTGNQVLLDLHAERSNIALAPSDIGVTFQKQETKTQILLNNGETAVISGMTIVEKSRVRTGIPILMDLPVLGALFRTTSDRETKKELLIMVTPTIVRDGEL